MSTHDVTDRRNNNMQRALDAMAGCVADLTAFASDERVVAGVAYSVADRLSRLIVELEQFRARDLINMREQAVAS
jgi:hypothetical protein